MDRKINKIFFTSINHTAKFLKHKSTKLQCEKPFEANATLTRGVHVGLQQIISTELSLVGVYPYERASACKTTWRLDVALEKNHRQSVHGKHARTTNRSIYCSARAFQFAALIIYIISCIGICRYIICVQ